jgi:hypothetical protein
MQNPGYSRTDSAYSDKPTPGVMGAGAAAGTGAGAGVGAGAAAGAIYNNPFSDSAPQMAQTGRPQSNAMAYQNIPSEQYWSNDGGAGGAQAGGYDSAPKSRKKWWIIGGVVAAVVVIAAVVGGVVGLDRAGARRVAMLPISTRIRICTTAFGALRIRRRCVVWLYLIYVILGRPVLIIRARFLLCAAPLRPTSHGIFRSARFLLLISCSDLERRCD